jgi:hypothetical protein
MGGLFMATAAGDGIYWYQRNLCCCCIKCKPCVVVVEVGILDSSCFQWPSGLRRRFAAVCLLGLRVRIALVAYMSVVCLLLRVVCC